MLLVRLFHLYVCTSRDYIPWCFFKLFSSDLDVVAAQRDHVENEVSKARSERAWRNVASRGGR